MVRLLCACAIVAAAMGIRIQAQEKRDGTVLDTTTVQIQTSYTGEQIADLPTNTIGGPSIGGQRPRNNIEGVDSNSKDITGPNTAVPSEVVAIPGAPASVSPEAPAISGDHILGIIPNFTTISDPHQAVAPLRVRDKWMLFVKETVDPFTFASAALGAAMSQSGNAIPQYGHGQNAYFQRVGAATADMATQNFFSTAVLAPLFHQDPRYYRMGPEHNIARRILYSVTRQFITRQDSGRAAFNISGVLGMGMGIALSNAYYPGADVNASVNRSRFVTSISGNFLSNLLPEFWPDIQRLQQKLFHHKN